jgi:Xaa-Pro aminopeptidase
VSTAGRADALAAKVAERELDALLVGEPFNLRWLTGFTGTNGLALVSPPEAGAGAGLRVFITDFRYVEQAEEEVGQHFDRRRGERDLLGDVRNALPERRPVKVGFDDAHTSVRTHRRLAKALGEEVELVAAGGLVEGLRAVKDADELALVRTAAEIADAALRQTLETGLAGRTERAVARALEDAMRDRGAEPSFPSTARCRTPSRATSRSRPARSSSSTSAPGTGVTARTARARWPPARSTARRARSTS